MSRDVPADHVVPEARAQMARSGAWHAVRIAVGLAMLVAVVPAVVDRVGAEAFGVFALALAVAAPDAPVDLGLSFALSRRTAAERAAGRTGSAIRLALRGARWLALLWLLAIVPLALLAPGPADGAAVLAFLLASLFAMLAIAPQACLSGLLQQELVARRIATVQASLWPLAWLAACAGAGLTGLLGVQAGLDALLLAMLWRDLRRAAAGRPAAPASAGLLREAASMLPFRLYQLVFAAGDRWVLASLGYLPALAPYEMARRLAEGLQKILWNWVTPLVPAAAMLSGTAPRSATPALASAARRPIFLFALPAALLVAAASADLTLAWVERRDPLLETALALLFLAHVGNVAACVPLALAAGGGALSRVRRASSAAALAHLALAFALGRAFGPAAALAATVLVAWSLDAALVSSLRAPGGIHDRALYRRALAHSVLVLALWLALGGLAADGDAARLARVAVPLALVGGLALRASRSRASPRA